MQVQPRCSTAWARGAIAAGCMATPVAGPPKPCRRRLLRKKNRSGHGHGDIQRSRDGWTDWYQRAREPDFAKIKVPLLSAASWGGQGLHPRGNLRGLSIRPRSEGEMARMPWPGALDRVLHALRRRACQKRSSSAYYLKGEKNGWEKKPPRAAEGPACGREIRRARRERMADQADPMDQKQYPRSPPT